MAVKDLCSAIARSRRRGRRQVFVMQAARQQLGAHPEALAESTAGQWCRGGHDEAGQVGKQPKDDSSQEDHATIVPRLAEGPATESVRPGSNFCGAHPTSSRSVGASVTSLLPHFTGSFIRFSRSRKRGSLRTES